MNLKKDLSISDLSKLLEPFDDNRTHHILWVNFQGDVNITPLPESLTPVGWAEKMKGKIKFRYETYIRGNKYVGPDAAKNQKYLKILLDDLKKDWKEDRSGYIDY